MDGALAHVRPLTHAGAVPTVAMGYIHDAEHPRHASQRFPLPHLPAHSVGRAQGGQQVAFEILGLGDGPKSLGIGGF
ncbi:hypothetical protein ES703_125838 [subsurface metagenome]